MVVVVVGVKVRKANGEKADGKAEGVLDGRVDRNELRVALAVWYTMQEKKRKETALSCCCGGRGPVEVDRRAGSYIPVRQNLCAGLSCGSACFVLWHALCSAVLSSLMDPSACSSLSPPAEPLRISR